MKQFMLSQFNENNGNYDVWFGNRICVEFGSKRHVVAFLADTNRFLTGSMVELNQLYCNLFFEYRQAWFTLMNFKNGVKVNLRDPEQNLQRIMNDIQEQFNRVGNTFHGTASGAWAFIHLQNICWMLKEGNDILIELNKRRNNTIQYHNLQVINERVKLVADRLGNYPAVLPANALSMKSNK